MLWIEGWFVWIPSIRHHRSRLIRGTGLVGLFGPRNPSPTGFKRTCRYHDVSKVRFGSPCFCSTVSPVSFMWLYFASLDESRGIHISSYEINYFVLFTSAIILCYLLCEYEPPFCILRCSSSIRNRIESTIAVNSVGKARDP